MPTASKMFYVYQITDAPAPSRFFAFRKLLGKIQIPLSLTHSPDSFMAFAKSKFKNIKSLIVSAHPLPKRVDDHTYAAVGSAFKETPVQRAAFKGILNEGYFK